MNSEIKKILMGLGVIVGLAAITTFLFIAADLDLPSVNKRDTVLSEAETTKQSSAFTPRALNSQQPKTNPKPPKIVRASSQEIRALEKQMKDFNLPSKVKKELITALKRNGLEEKGAKGPLDEQELVEAGLSLRQIARSGLSKEAVNINSGYRVEDEDFDNMLKASLYSVEADSLQARQLKSAALASLGFSSLAEHNYHQAEKAFKSFISDYPDTESAPMVRLEYCRLLLEQGRIQEAKVAVDEVISLYSNDQEFVNLAQGLKAQIQNDE